MVGTNKNRWLPFQLSLLEQLADARTPWSEIARRVGHPKNSCATKMSEIRCKRDRKHEPSKRGRPRKTPPADCAPQLAPPASVSIPDPPYARSNTSTAKLLADAELRARIAVLGVTSGLLGDPLPGRSALDQKRAGLTEQAPSYDRRFADNRLKVTLATEPLR